MELIGQLRDEAVREALTDMLHTPSVNRRGCGWPPVARNSATRQRHAGTDLVNRLVQWHQVK